MEVSKEKVELVQLAIQRLMEEQRAKKSNDDDDGDGHRLLLLRRLLSELETLEGDGKIQQHKAPADQEDSPHSPALVGGGTESKAANDESGGNEEIAKELGKIKRQNFVTHCLLSAMIALTVVWQLSEVSLVLRLKDGLNHPFKSLGGMLAGLLKRPIKNARNGDKETESSDRQQQFSPLRIPEMTQLDLPLGLDKED
ncbi:uncharacterized protein LOC127797692 [Diospyros lotus]|uniref:uncharacterized protein LOC127797692 n=1 Tax=Diospyros lotus TaxID=55363 RepID=UPI0022520A0D|nr:uncharacterized protein LOC127797692 [Diospyros lotus]